MSPSATRSRKQTITMAICALCLVVILLLTGSQSGPGGGGRIIRQDLVWLPFRFILGKTGDSNNATSPEADGGGLDQPAVWPTKSPPSGLFDPFNELSSMRQPSLKSSNSSGGSKRFRLVYPNLYRALTKLTDPPASVAPHLLDTPTTKENVSACTRPGDKNLVHLLNKSTSSFPFARPTYRGGFWSPKNPKNCWPPLSRTAVLVPYRNRSENLDLFVPYMQTVLQQQGIVYGIFVIEQANAKLFNRAKLLNVGFRVAQQFAKFDCFVLQDADKVPENIGNVYDCANSPKLMISEMRRQGDSSRKYYRGRMYNNFLGGSAAISKQVFERVNGNSNRYYGWGREDDELASRLSIRGRRIHYPGGHLARFINLKHSNDVIVNTMPWPYQHKVKAAMDNDGLNTLNYTDRGIYLHDLFVLIRADV